MIFWVLIWNGKCDRYLYKYERYKNKENKLNIFKML